jgi:hypothetical protein
VRSVWFLWLPLFYSLMSLYFPESFRDGPRDRTLALFAMKIRKEIPNVKTDNLESASTPLCSHDLREYAPLCRPERDNECNPWCSSSSPCKWRSYCFTTIHSHNCVAFVLLLQIPDCCFVKSALALLSRSHYAHSLPLSTSQVTFESASCFMILMLVQRPARLLPR